MGMWSETASQSIVRQPFRSEFNGMGVRPSGLRELVTSACGGAGVDGLGAAHRGTGRSAPRPSHGSRPGETPGDGRFGVWHK